MATPNGNRSITLTDEQCDTLLVAQLAQLRTSMEIATQNAEELGTMSASNSKRPAKMDDMRTSLRVLHEDLEALAALGLDR